MNHIHASPTGWDKCPIPEGFITDIWSRDKFYPDVIYPNAYTWGRVRMFKITGIAEGYTLC